MSPLIETLPIEDLERALATSLGSTFQLKDVEWKPLTDPGENFGSVIIAIKATIVRNNNSETLNLVAKMPPKSAYLLDLFDSPTTFKKELHFYNVAEKAFRDLQMECGLPEESLSEIAAKHYGGRLGIKSADVFDEQAVIVLENLKLAGYDTKDRITGLDKEHAEVAVKELARMHGLSIGLKLKKPKYFEEQVVKVFQRQFNETAEKCVTSMVRKGQQDMKNVPETKPYWDRIDKTVEHGLQFLQGRVPEEPWGTIIHNDFWVNNMMFKDTADGKVAGFRMVDFQLCAYDYGMCDLIFFLMSSVQDQVIDNCLNYFLDLYYNTFIDTLSSLQVDTSLFTKEKYDELIKLCAPQKLNQCIMMVHVIKSSRKAAHELKNTEGEDMFLKRGGDEICNGKLLHTAKVFVERDWLLK